MKHYEKLMTTPIALVPEEQLLAASGEVTTCRIDNVTATVSPFIEDDITKTFDFSME